jgi:hypothetical protein
MWESVRDEDRNEAWGAALSKFSAESIAKAVRDLPDNPSHWPPTLPEFIALVRAAAAERAHQVKPIALPDDTQVVEPERARELMADLLKGMKRVPG